MPESQTQPIPVTIVGGYLGSGKTTLVNHLLRNADGRRLAVMVNDFGELSIDANLIETQDDNLISLAGGCVCCSYGDDMITAMDELVKMSPIPDHVVLEASGVAIPGMIASSISIMDCFRLEGIVVVTDGPVIREQANDTYLSDTIERQISDGDILLLNKSDTMKKTALDETTNWLEGKSKAAVIATKNSEVPPEVLLRDYGRDQEYNSHEKSTHLAGYRTTSFDPGIVQSALAFGNDLIEKNPEMIRAKGFIAQEDGAMKTIQIVGKRLDIYPAPTNVKSGIVTISKQ